MPTAFALQRREIIEDDFADPAVESVFQAEIVGGGGQVLSRATAVRQLQVCVVPLASLHVTWKKRVDGNMVIWQYGNAWCDVTGQDKTHKWQYGNVYQSGQFLRSIIKNENLKSEE